jgi:CBS-domain-containing membrane protein
LRDSYAARAVQLILMERIKKLPAMEEDRDKVRLVGILSITDIAKIQPDLLEDLKHLAGEDAETMAEQGFDIR